MTISHQQYELERIPLRQLAAFADAFFLLAIACEQPTHQLASACIDGSISNDMSSLCNEGAFSSIKVHEAIAALDQTYRQQTIRENVLRDLRREHTRLFEHPENPAIPLYEEQYLFKRSSRSSSVNTLNNSSKFDQDLRPRLFVNPASLDALREYKQAGMKQTSERAMPADAMPVQMTFMGKLYTQALQAKIEANYEMTHTTQKNIQEFYHYHLDKWMVSFFMSCAEISKEPLYKAVGFFGTALYEAANKTA